MDYLVILGSIWSVWMKYTVQSSKNIHFAAESGQYPYKSAEQQLHYGSTVVAWVGKNPAQPKRGIRGGRNIS